MRGWSLPITDSYASRQAQTAITAQMLAKGDQGTLTPFNGLGPPWSVPLEFPTYQLLTAGLARGTGLNIISCGRVIAIMGAILTAAALFQVTRRADLPLVARVVAVALLLLSPLFAHYSRVVMIETWATGLSLWWLVAMLEAQWAQSSRSRAAWITGAVVLGMIAAPTKITTFTLFLLAAGIFAMARSVRSGSAALRYFVFGAAPAVFSAVAWTRASDAANAAHPYADFLVSSVLSDWVWGSLQQRLDPAWWKLWGHHLDMISPWWTYLAIPLGLILGTFRQRCALTIALLAAVAGPLAFANLYFVHEYYSMAVAPACVAAIVIGASAVWMRWVDYPIARIPILLAVVIAASHNVWSYQAGLGRRQMRAAPPPALATVLRELTTPADTILIYGSDWDPLVTFYAERPITFVRATHETSEASLASSRAKLAPRDYTVLVATGNVAGDRPFLARRCQQLGLAETPAASTPEADIYLAADTQAQREQILARLRATHLVAAEPITREPAAQTREVWVDADWRSLVADEATRFFTDLQPLPTQIFAMHRLTKINVEGKELLHLHPESGLRFKATARPRTLRLRFGMSSRLWEESLPSDGVRLRLWFRERNIGTHLAWERWLNPVNRPEDRGTHEVTVTVPARRTVQLEIDCGPGRDPGFDWVYLESIEIRP